MQLAGGEVFAGYTIVRALGAGGAGEVYLAQHPRLPRQDALKILGPQVSANSAYRERFLREADRAADLAHPNIVTVFDRGDDQGQLWISMAYIPGEDAARLLARRWPAGMPVALASAIVTAVAAALDYAHRKGVLHRDVKPGNILISGAEEPAERRILLADFGIARDVDDPDGLTTTNTTLGTVAYAAPEQLMGEQIDGRADQYALAAAAYHLLTGKLIFPHTNAAVVISHHLNSVPPALSATRPDLAALDPVLLAALAKDPRGRFASCSDFARAFAEQAKITATIPPSAPTAPAPTPMTARPAAAGSVSAPPPSRPRRRAPLVAAGVAAVIAASAGGGWLWWDNRPPDASPLSPAPTSPGPPPPPAPPPPVKAPTLDGTYRVQEIEGRTDVRWMGFRDACSPAGCIATSEQLDPKNLSAPADTPQSEVWHWTGDTWQSTWVGELSCWGPEGEARQTEARTKTLSPTGDGNFRLSAESTTISNECNDEGVTGTSQYTVTRTGPAPIGVVADPPTSLIGQLPPPLPQPTRTPTPKSVDVTVDGQPFASPDFSCFWSKDGELEVYVKNAAGDIYLSVDDITSTGTGAVTLRTDGRTFDNYGGRGGTATQTGRASFTVVAAVEDFLSKAIRTVQMDVSC